MSNTSPVTPFKTPVKTSRVRNATTKVRTFASKHKRPLIAVTALSAMVAGSAYFGRATADKTVNLEIVEVDDEETDKTA